MAVSTGTIDRLVHRLGDNAFKGLYSLVSLAGFVLIVWGYGLARQQPVPRQRRRHMSYLTRVPIRPGASPARCCHQH